MYANGKFYLIKYPSDAAIRQNKITICFLFRPTEQSNANVTVEMITVRNNIYHYFVIFFTYFNLNILYEYIKLLLQFSLVTGEDACNSIRNVRESITRRCARTVQ